ncbi:hypothetical protein [Enterobacter soli]|uniref:hypothetical protein n=2 Tax=Enterobacter soli TaxID=885040 RepID=UPI0020CC4C4C|nr:hypothetical protein [Enterobacter soli]
MGSLSFFIEGWFSLMSLIVLITHDNYLFQGLQYYISLKHIRDLKQTGEHHQECIILIDSRTPLNILERQWRAISRRFERTRAVVLCMNEPASPPVDANSKDHTIDMSAVVGRLIPTIYHKAEIVMPDKWRQSVRIEMNEQEMALINAFLSGMQIEDIADMFYCSQKQVYKLRDKVCQRMKMKHFYTACIYIFRHGLLNQNYTLPETWLRA